MLKELSGVELLAHLSACWLYAEHHAGKISREDGAKTKRIIVQALEETVKSQNKCSFAWARLESASRAYSQNKTIENADKFFSAVYNLNDKHD